MAEMFDKIIGGISTGVTTVKEGAKNIAEKAKINSKIAELKNKNRNDSIEIGHKVYEYYKRGKLNGFDDLRELCVHIDSRMIEIKKHKEDLKNLD